MRITKYHLYPKKKKLSKLIGIENYPYSKWVKELGSSKMFFTFIQPKKKFYIPTNRLTPRTSWLHPNLFIFGHLIVLPGTDSHPQLKPKAKSHSPIFSTTLR